MKNLLILIIMIIIGANTYAQNLTFDQKVIAICLLGEARSEGKDGIMAVAEVIRNRSNKRNLSPSAVCLQPFQFSVFNGKSITDLEWLLKKEGEIFDYAKNIAVNFDTLVTGNTVNGADHYFASWLKKPPYWAKGQTPVRVIKNHIFYRL